MALCLPSDNIQINLLISCFYTYFNNNCNIDMMMTRISRLKGVHIHIKVIIEKQKYLAMKFFYIPLMWSSSIGGRNGLNVIRNPMKMVTFRHKNITCSPAHIET